MSDTSSPLIPAKAGTQVPKRRDRKAGRRRCITGTPSPMTWIPAFAGMSGSFAIGLAVAGRGGAS